jgi:signal transduction histidine kinase
MNPASMLRGHNDLTQGEAMAAKKLRTKVSVRWNDKDLLTFTRELLERVKDDARCGYLLAEAAARLLDLTQCEAVEIWLDRGSAFLRYGARRGHRGEYLPAPDPSSRLARACAQAAHREDAGEAPLQAQLWNGRSPSGEAEGPDAAWGAVLVLPLGNGSGGALVIADAEPGACEAMDIPFLAETARILGLAISLQQPREALVERVKELTCLFGLSRLVQQSSLSLSQLLQGIADLIPAAWQYPEHASCRVSFDGERFTSAGFRETDLCQRASIQIRGLTRGGIEVFYDEQLPPSGKEGPFLAEEWNLLDGLRREVALAIERRQLEKEREQLLEQIRHMDRLATVGRFAASIAHELNEPLCGILGLAQLAVKDQELSPQAKGDLQKIIESSLHARDVVKGFLTFSRSGRSESTGLSLNQLILDVLDLFTVRCARDGITVRLDLEPELPMLEAVPSQMRQVLVNLIVNGIQAMPRGGTLTLGTLCTDGTIRLLVADTGVGMEDEVIQKIFTPFFTTKEAGHGTGLGLGIVQDIVASHGGQLRVESQRHAGSRFTVELPMARVRTSGDN